MNRLVLGESGCFGVFPAVPAVVIAGQRGDGGAGGTGCRDGSRRAPGFRRFPGWFRDRGGETTLGRRRRPRDDGEGFGDVQVLEDGSEVPLEEELAAALAGPVQQFAGMLTWTARQAGRLDHGEREKTIAESGRELQRQLLESTFTIDCAREERAAPLTSAAGIRHGTVEKGAAGAW